MSSSSTKLMRTLLALAVIASLILSSCNRPAPAPAPAPNATTATTEATTAPEAVSEATATPAPQRLDLPPALVSTSPARGQEQPLDAPVVLTFDQPLAASSTAAFSITPETPGQTKVEGNTLVFTPDQPLERGVLYRVAVTEQAQGENGKALTRPVEIRFHTVGFLEVTNTQPATANAAVDADAPITVIFNRPVVPLTTIDQAADPVPVLSFDPPVSGKGHWLNTSIYSFVPDSPLASGEQYKATVEKGLTGADGGLLAEAKVFTFTIASPAVGDIAPSGVGVWPTQAITVTFTQPMDRAATEAALTVRGADSKQPVAGRAIWSDDSRMLCFEPLRPLDYETPYAVEVSTAARAASGKAAIERAAKGAFTTAPRLALVRTTPADGDTGVAVEESMEIVFKGVIDEKSLGREAFDILPEPTDVFSYFNSYDNTWVISWPRLPQTAYTVTLSPTIADVFDNTLGKPAVVRFETGARRPFANLNIPNEFGTYNAYTSTLAAVTYRNVSRLDFKLYSVNETTAVRLTGMDRWSALSGYTPLNSALLREWSVAVSPDADTNNLLKVPLMEDGSPLPSGIYWLEMRAPEVTYDPQNPKGQQIPRHLLVVSPFNIVTKRSPDEMLVWVTDLRTGQPVAGVPVRVLNNIKTEGVTDKDGLFRGEIKTDTPDLPAPVFVGDAAPVTSLTPAPAGQPRAFGMTGSDWQMGLASWDFSLPSESPQFFQGYFYTDRPIYRPGQTVYWRGILRQDQDAILRTPEPGTEARVIIRNDRGEEIYNQIHKTTDFGTISGELPLAEDAGVGYYAMEVQLPQLQNAYSQPYFGVGFQVAEYRKPEFLITMTPGKTEVLNGDVISATVSGEFFFGGPVSNVAVEWTAFSEDAFFNYVPPADGPQRWYSFNDYTGWDPTQQGRYGGLVGKGSGKTGADGKFTLSLPANIDKELTSQRYTLDVRVTDLTNQESSQSTSVMVHKSLVYAGVAPRGYVAQVGQPATVDLITVDWGSKPVADQKLTVVVSQAEWRFVEKKAEDGNFYWVSEVKETPVLTDTVTTGRDGEAEFTWTPKVGGQYKITAAVTDKLGNTARGASFIWASTTEAGQYVAWEVANNDRLKLVADKPLYQVGDTAKVLVPHPFQGPVEALVTVERGSILDVRRMTLTGNSEVLEVPITEDYAPDVFVSVVIVKGMDDAASRSDLGLFKVGLAELKVDPSIKEIKLALTPSEEIVRPGQVVTFTVEATDNEGQPVQAELSLALIDKAILSLAQSTNAPLLASFYRERGLGVTTASNLVYNLDRLNQQLQEGAKGGGGGGGGFDMIALRSEFEDTALWQPTVRTDAEGRAQVSVKLPDNLTTWHLEGIAVTVDTLVGQATVEIKASLPLLVRPVLPRFFTAGDQAEIGAVVNNNTDADRTVTVVMETDVLTTTASLEQVLRVPAGSQARATWPVEVLSPAADEAEATARVRFTAQESGANAGDTPLGDAAEYTLPVLRYNSPETVATSGVVGPDDARTEVIWLPDTVDPTQGDLHVRVEPSLAAGMVASLNWLEHFPYECNEQIVSKFLPNVATYQALQTLKLERPDLKAHLQDQVALAVQRLAQSQNSDGGWGWIKSDESRPFVSAYVVFGLQRAHAAGFAVDSALLERGADYLTRQLTPPAVQRSYRANEQAFLLYVLADGGHGDTGRTVALYESRATLDHYGKALLALAFGRIDDPTSAERIAVLLDELNAAAILSATGAHWEEQDVDYWTMNSDLRSTALALDALATLGDAAATATPAAGSDATPHQAQPVAANAVRWLMNQRVDGRWATTQENVWSLIALTDWMAATRELQGDYSYQVTLNGNPLAEGVVDADTVGQPVDLHTAIRDLLLEQSNGLVISRSTASGQSGAGQLYYSAYLNYYLPASELPARDRGLVLAQQYRLYDPVTGKASDKPITEAKIGDTIQVKLTLVAPTNMHYLLVESPLPAGAEAIDPTLTNTSVVYDDPSLQRVDKKQPWYWWTPTAVELRDEKAALFATDLPAGTYEYTYLMRASLPGRFQVLPAVAYQMYFPEVWGRSAGAEFVIGNR